MNRLFEIQTLSECNTNLKSYQSLKNGGSPVDPVTIITGGLAVLQQLFPGLFGQPAIPMTEADWIKMFPGNGYWTSLLRNYLKSKIPNTRDLWRIERFTGYFVWQNRNAIAPNVPSSCYPYDEPHRCPEAMELFYKLLQKEAAGGGGGFPPVPTFNYQTLLLIGGGVLLIAALSKKKGSKKR